MSTANTVTATTQVLRVLPGLALFAVGGYLYVECARSTGTYDPMQVVFVCIPNTVVSKAGELFDGLGQWLGIDSAIFDWMKKPITREILMAILPRKQVNIHTTDDLCQFVTAIQARINWPKPSGDPYDCKTFFDGLGNQLIQYKSYTPAHFEILRDFFKGVIRADPITGYQTIYAWVSPHTYQKVSYQALVIEIALKPDTAITYKSYYGTPPIKPPTTNEVNFDVLCGVKHGVLTDLPNNIVSCTTQIWPAPKVVTYFNRNTDSVINK